jgi:recombination protein RecA
LRGIVDKANKKFGIGTVVYGRELRQQVIERTTSGSLALDEALGGGWPLNQWNEIVGDESSGKTVVALQTIAANQRASKRWTAVWVAAEWLPPEWAEANGVDLDRMLVINTNLMEEVFDLVTEFVESREIDCLVIDSLPALIPETEDEQTMAEFAVGVGARLTGKFFRKQYKAVKRSLVDSDDRNVLALMINQWREKIGVMHGDPRTTPGGKGKNFAFFTRTTSSKIGVAHGRAQAPHRSAHRRRP